MRTNRHPRRLALGILLIALAAWLTFAVALRSTPRARIRVGAAAGREAPSASPVSVPTPAVPRVVVPAGGVRSGPVPLPATTPVAEPSCPATDAASTMVTITISNEPMGFAQPCYYASASQVLTVDMINDAVNSKTMLPFPMAFSLAPSAHPEFSPVQGKQGGLIADSSSVLAVSPTALDSTPIAFRLGPFAPGRYVLQLTTLPEAAAAILTIT